MAQKRFAALVRVSTPGQSKDRKTSFEVQKDYIKDCVEILEGIIPDDCWYIGDEHATPNHERKILDGLLDDCTKNKFDCVIVNDASRWSRNITKHEEATRTFVKHDIQFYSGIQPIDLTDENLEVTLQLQVVLNQYLAKVQKGKSIKGKIKQAELHGMPSGKPPFGRRYDKKSGEWTIIEEEAEKIRTAARRYLAGEGTAKIAASLGMNHPNLWKILTKRSGTTWPVEFHPKDLPKKFHKTVQITVPRLLDDETIAAIIARAKTQRTYHGKNRHDYLLSGFIRCARCGYAMFAQINHGAIRYYRHPRGRVRPCTQKRWTPADMVENAVLLHLLRTLGDVELMEKAVEDATPNKAKRAQLVAERTQLEKEIQKIEAAKARVMDFGDDGTYTKDEVAQRLQKHRGREPEIQSRLSCIESELAADPDPAAVRRWSKLASGILASIAKDPSLQKWFTKKPFASKRKLVERAFAGQGRDGTPLGVYVDSTDDPAHPWTLDLRAGLENAALSLPFSDEYLEEAFRLDSDYQDIATELKRIRVAYLKYPSR